MNTISDKIVNIRKPQYCDACDRKFPAGTNMRTATCTGDGEIWQWKECPTCNELLKRFPKDFDDGWGMFERCCVADVLNIGETPEMVLDAKLKQFNKG